MIKDFWNSISKEGMHMPFVHDARTGKPSITLLFAYMTFILAFVSSVMLHFNSDIMMATFTSILFWVVSVVFYRLRNIDKAKIDFDDKSLELSGNSNKQDDED